MQPYPHVEGKPFMSHVIRATMLLRFERRLLPICLIETPMR